MFAKDYKYTLTWKRDLEKEMWTAGFRYNSWRNMEAAAQDRAGWR